MKICQGGSGGRFFHRNVQLFLSQVVNEPTRPSGNGLAGSLLDLVFVSNLLCVTSCQTIPSLSNSDHLGLSISASLGGLTNHTMTSH